MNSACQVACLAADDSRLVHTACAVHARMPTSKRLLAQAPLSCIVPRLQLSRASRISSCKSRASAGDAPRWVYFSCGAAAFTYLHLDCIDGKQARRTKSSSPLGQLFDHGAPHELMASQDLKV